MKAQGIMEYLLLVGGGIIMAVIVFGVLLSLNTNKESEKTTEQEIQAIQEIQDTFTQQNFDGNVLQIECFKTNENPNLVCVRRVFSGSEIFVLPIKGV